MRFFTLLLTFVFTTNALAVDPPVSVKSQLATAKQIYKYNLNVPNLSGTNLGGLDSLLETGNKNILDDASFEASTRSALWVSTAGTLAQETTIVIDGKKSLKVTLAAQAMATTQDSTLYQAQFADGIQGLAMVRVKTTVAGIQVCSRQATVNSTICVPVDSTGKWGLYKVPFILGATSNGISINSNAVSVTGDVYIDDSFAGAVDLKADAGQCVTANCTDTFSAKLSISGVVSDENIDWINGNCVQASGLQTCTLNTIGLTTGMNCTVVGNANTRIPIVQTSSSTTVAVEMTNTAGASTSSATSLICQKQGADYASAVRLRTGGVYTAQNADTAWASCGHTAADFAGFGTVTAIETQCKRDGSDLLMRGKFTAGTPTAAEARLALRNQGAALTSASTASIPSIQLAGDGAQNTSSAVYFREATLIEPSVTYLTFGHQTSTLNAYTKAAGNNLVAAGGIYSILARVPIAGWETSNIIIGSFQGYNFTPGVNTVEFFSVSYGTTNISTVCSTTPCFISQIGTAVSSVSRTGAGAYALNTVKTYSSLNCDLTSGIGSGATRVVPVGVFGCNACNTIPFSTNTIITDIATNSLGTLMCQGIP